MSDSNLKELFQYNLGDDLKNIAMQSNNEDHARLKALAQEAGLNQGEVLRLLLNFVDIAVHLGTERQVFEESLPMSKMERFILLVALDMGLLPQQQLDIVITFARDGRIARSAMIDAILSLIKNNVEGQNISSSNQ
jgi:hypothetical protein